MVKQSTMTMTDLDKIFLSRDVDLAEGRVSARIKCPPDLAAFDGHFPGQPVLPAVIQLAAVRTLASSIAGVDLVPVSTGRLKFSAMVLPDEELDLKLNMEQKSDCWEVGFRLTRDGGKVSAGTIIYREAGN